jgi:hypothetical protein
MLSFDNAHKHIHNINSDGCEPRENWEKIFGPSTSEKIITTPEVATWAGGKARVRVKIDLYTAYISRDTQIIGQGIVQFSWNQRKRWLKSKTSCLTPFWPKKLTTHLIGNSHHNHIRPATLYTNTPTLIQSTSQTTIDIFRHTTNHTITPPPRAKLIPPSQSSPTLCHHYIWHTPHLAPKQSSQKWSPIHYHLHQHNTQSLRNKATISQPSEPFTQSP